VLVVASVVLLCGCRPSGISDFKASHQAIQNVSHASAEWSTKNDKGSFKYTAEFDCATPYYHRASAVDLTPKGVADGTRSELGAPVPHQGVDLLFVDGREFSKSATGVWEWTPPYDWKEFPVSHNPSTECEALRAGKDPEMGPFAAGNHFYPILDFPGIVKENKIEYLTERVVADGRCREYRVTYQDAVEYNRLPTSNGEYISYDARPVQAVVCLGSKDHLPRQAAQGGWTFTYSYGSFEKLPAPETSSAVADRCE
jgi:hypothetical protein